MTHHYAKVNRVSLPGWYILDGQAHLIYTVVKDSVITCCHAPIPYSVYDSENEVVLVRIAEPGEEICPDCIKALHRDQNSLRFLQKREVLE